MNSRILIILVFILTACGAAPVRKSAIEPPSVKNDATAAVQTQSPGDNGDPSDSAGQNMATYFVVVADTSLDYYFLRKEMLKLNRQLKIPIDSMGRFYNKAKNLIALPDNDDDEIYAGDYYPRRYPSENLSLEYLNFYQGPAGKKTIALVTGIYEAEKSADSALRVLQRAERKSFKIKSEIYIGCMH